MRALFAVLASLFFVLGLSGCGERAQVTEPTKQGKYQGKPDTQAWANAPLPEEFRGGSWKQGDRTSWEEQIKNRQLAQHEHKRIYQ
jgi:hypothetical protein